MHKFIATLLIFSAYTTYGQNNSLSFNGSSQYVSISDNNSIDLSANFTLEGWIYPTGAGSQPTEGGMILNKEGSYEIARFADGTLRYALSANGAGSDWTWISTGLTAPLNTWTHFALVKSGTSLSFYVNTSSVYTNNSAPATLTANAAELRLANRTNTGHYFNGRLDEIRIWNTARTQAQLKNSAYGKSITASSAGLVAWYRMNETSGSSTANSCTNSTGIDGSLVASPSWVASPVQVAAGAMSFDGTDDVVDIPDDNSLDLTNALTIEAWVYATKNTGIQDVVSKSNISTNNGYIFPRTNDGWANLTFYLHIGGSWRIMTVPYNMLNAWHHLAATYDGSTMRVYIDGAATGTPVSISGSIIVNANPLAIGNQPGFAENFGGVVDDIRVWNVVRTPAQIQNNRLTEIDPSAQTGLVSYYTFNHGITNGTNTGLTTLMDMKSNNNGTLSGLALTGTSSNLVPQGSGLFVLPVNWVSFTAEKKNQTSWLRWTTSGERNNREFSIEHSTDGSNWQQTGTVAPAAGGNDLNTYSYIHLNPVKGINYYRIRQTDLDGRFSYSKIIPLVFNEKENEVLLYPNPAASGSLVYVQLKEASRIQVYDFAGRLVLSQNGVAGSQQLETGKLAAGVYQLKAGKTTLTLLVQ